MSVSNIWSCLMLYQVKLIKSQRSKSKNTCPTLLQWARRCKRVILIPTHLPNGCSWLSAWALFRVGDLLMLPCSPCLRLPHPGITGLQRHARLLSKNIGCCCQGREKWWHDRESGNECLTVSSHLCWWLRSWTQRAPTRQTAAQKSWEDGHAGTSGSPHSRGSKTESLSYQSELQASLTTEQAVSKDNKT